MNKIVKALAPVALITSMSAQADVIGATIEASYWKASPSGKLSSQFAAQLPEQVDVKDNLGYGSEGFFEFTVSVEHPVPLAPNVKVSFNDMGSEETGTLLNTFMGVGAGLAKSTLDVSHYDLILYYEVLDNWITADVGIDVKKFNGEFFANAINAQPTFKSDINKTIPGLYARGDVELPFTGMMFGLEATAGSLSSSGVLDARARIRQNISVAFIELGYRKVSLDLEDLGPFNVDVDTDYSGVYLSTGLDF